MEEDDDDQGQHGQIHLKNVQAFYFAYIQGMAESLFISVSFFSKGVNHSLGQKYLEHFSLLQKSPYGIIIIEYQ